MAVGITITGTKDEFAAHLHVTAGEHTNIAKATSGAEKARQQGIAEGLEIASAMTRQWTGEPATAGNGHQDAPHEYGAAFSQS